MKTGIAPWIFLATFLLFFAKGKAQTSAMPYRLEIKDGENLRDAVQQLAENYRIDFAYAPDVLAKKQLTAASLSAPDMESLLQQLLKGASIQYHMLSPDRILLRSFNLKSSREAGESVHLSGRITEAENGESMPNVAIALDTLNLGTLSDQNGRFSLQIPAELRDHKVWIYHIGYKTINIPLTKFREELSIHLQAEPFSLNEVLIVDQLPPLFTSGSDGSISIQQQGLRGLNASSLAGNDLFRRIQLQAGVSATNDLSSEIRIRGSDADETLILLDGIPLYHVDHFYGIFSALNSAYLDKVKLYKNILPIQYGGRTGGMLLMESADRIDQLSGQADLDLLSAALSLEVPLTRQLGFSFSARRSHTDLTDSKLFDWVDRDIDNYFDSEFLDNRSDILTIDPDFGFFDWNAKMLFRPGEQSRLAVNFFRSNDDYLNTYYDRFSTRFDRERVQFEENFSNQQNWKNTGASLQYETTLGKDWTLDLEAFYSRYQFTEALQVAISRTTPLLGTRTNTLRNDQDNLVENSGTRLLLNKTYQQDQLLEAGVSWNQYRTDFTIVSELDTLLSNSRQSFDMQSFAGYRWEPLERLELYLGGRLNYYRQTGGWYFAPRVLLDYELTNGLSLKGAYGIHYQFIRELTHENRLSQSVDVVVLSDERRFPIGRSDHFMLGANYQWNHWSVDVELYHKKRYNVLDHSSTALGFGDDPLRPGERSNYRIFVGDGTVNGVDVTLAWEYPHYYGHLAYTLSKAVNRFPAIQHGTPIPARDDRRHQLKWVNTWQWRRFDFSANFIYTSGRPYFDQRVVQGDRRRDYVRWLPSYQRVDLGVDYNLKLGKTKAKVGFSVFNLTDHDNVRYLQFIYSTNPEETNRTINRVIGNQTDLLDRTFNLRLGWEF